jgi:hypothetical protein
MTSTGIPAQANGVTGWVVNASFFNRGTADQAEAERGAHQAGEQGNQHPFAEVVFRHGFFLFRFRQFLFLGHAGHADQHDAEERHQHANEGSNSRIGLEQLAEFALQDFRHDGSRRRTEAAAHGQAEPDAEVTDHQPPGQSAEAPRRAAQVAIPKLLARRGVAMSSARSMLRAPMVHAATRLMLASK